MGYVKTKNAIQKVRSYLDQMVASQVDLQWKTDDARLAYRIREGITAARANGIAPYGNLSGKFIIRTIRGGVIAEIRNKFEGDALAELKAAAAVSTLPAIDGATGIVGAAITYKAHEMFFPDAVLSEEDLLMLYKWCGKNDYFIIDHQGDGTTITKTNPGEIAWTPPEKGI